MANPVQPFGQEISAILNRYGISDEDDAELVRLFDNFIRIREGQAAASAAAQTSIPTPSATSSIPTPSSTSTDSGTQAPDYMGIIAAALKLGQANTKPAKTPASPKFTGSPSEVEPFLSSVNRYMVLHPRKFPNLRYKFLWTLAHFEGSKAEPWQRTYSDTMSNGGDLVWSSWEEFLSVIHTGFGAVT